MSTTKKQDAPKPTATPGRQKVAIAIAEALETVENNGSLCHTVCESAAAVFKGKLIPPHDVKAIVSAVAKKRKWSAASLSSRVSEVALLLAVYDQLPGAIKQYREAFPDSFTWHDAMKVARKVRKAKKDGEPVESVVKAMTEEAKPDEDAAPVRRPKIELTDDQLTVYQQAIDAAKSQLGVKKESDALLGIMQAYLDVSGSAAVSTTLSNAEASNG